MFKPFLSYALQCAEEIVHNGHVAGYGGRHFTR